MYEVTVNVGAQDFEIDIVADSQDAARDEITNLILATGGSLDGVRLFIKEA